MNTIFSQQATNPSEDSEPSDTTTDKEATKAVHQNGHDNEEKNTENGSEQTLNTEEEEDLEDESRGQKNATKKCFFTECRYQEWSDAYISAENVGTVA